MAFCLNCGNQVPDGIKFCTSCGKPVAGETPAAPVQAVAPPPPPQQQPAPQPAYAAPPPAAVYKEEPISTGGYIGIMLLMLIPGLNFLFLIIWACGGCNKVNKRNLARAVLVWAVIGAVLAAFIFLTGSLLFGDQINALKEWGTTIMENNP